MIEQIEDTIKELYDFTNEEDYLDLYNMGIVNTLIGLADKLKAELTLWKIELEKRVN